MGSSPTWAGSAMSRERIASSATVDPTLAVDNDGAIRELEVAMEKPWERSADAGRRLAGRRALVTGASSGEGLIGIGAAIAALFADPGCQGRDRRAVIERADRARRLVEEIGGECVVALGDLTDAARAPAASTRLRRRSVGSTRS